MSADLPTTLPSATLLMNRQHNWKKTGRIGVLPLAPAQVPVVLAVPMVLPMGLVEFRNSEQPRVRQPRIVAVQRRYREQSLAA